MSKGASNRYGNKGRKSQHIGYQWAKGFNKFTLKEHFERHGPELKINTIEDYAAKAVNFANFVDKKNNLCFIDKNGSTYKFNKKTRYFCVVTSDGYVVTYYKTKLKYFYNEIGKKSK